MTDAEIEKWVHEYLGYLAISDDLHKAKWLRLLIQHALERGRQAGVQQGYEIMQAARERTEADYPAHAVADADSPTDPHRMADAVFAATAQPKASAAQ